MPSWYLILTLALPGQEPQAVAVGVLINRQACAVAGAGMVHVLTQATPEAQISWACIPAGEAA
jgi:hypothetical protein